MQNRYHKHDKSVEDNAALDQIDHLLSDPIVEQEVGQIESDWTHPEPAIHYHHYMFYTYYKELGITK